MNAWQIIRLQSENFRCNFQVDDVFSLHNYFYHHFITVRPYWIISHYLRCILLSDFIACFLSLDRNYVGCKSVLRRDASVDVDSASVSKGKVCGNWHLLLCSNGKTGEIGNYRGEFVWRKVDVEESLECFPSILRFLLWVFPENESHSGLLNRKMEIFTAQLPPLPSSWKYRNDLTKDAVENDKAHRLSEQNFIVNEIKTV